MNINLLFACLSLVAAEATQCMTIQFENPCYKKNHTAKSVTISNGAVLNFASNGIIGNTIRSATSVNEIPNDLGLTHTGVALVDNVMHVYNLIDETLRKGDEDIEKYANYSFQQIYKGFPEVIDTDDKSFVSAFSLESNGSAGQVIQGILPHVQISPLKLTLQEYDGNVYFRNLHTPISMDFSRNFLKDHLFQSYEIDPTEMVKATKGLNIEEKTESVFCSELAALIYEKANVIEPVNASNALPEHFCHLAMNWDILRGKAYNDIPLKYKFNATRAGEKSIWGKMVANTISFFAACFGH